MFELTVILKDSEKTFRQKFCVYEDVTLSKALTDPLIDQCIKEARTNFVGDPEDVVIKISMQV